jgi:hypothetical protein
MKFLNLYFRWTIEDWWPVASGSGLNRYWRSSAVEKRWFIKWGLTHTQQIGSTATPSHQIIIVWHGSSFMKLYFNSDCMKKHHNPRLLKYFLEILNYHFTRIQSDLTNNKARSRRKAKFEIIMISYSVRQSEMRTKPSENESEKSN